MSDGERTQLITRMGVNIAQIDTAVREKDYLVALAAFAKFMGAAGFLAHEIDELNNAHGN